MTPAIDKAWNQTVTVYDRRSHAQE